LLDEKGAHESKIACLLLNHEEVFARFTGQ
jgi:hypothetical protein